MSQNINLFIADFILFEPALSHGDTEIYRSNQLTMVFLHLKLDKPNTGEEGIQYMIKKRTCVFQKFDSQFELESVRKRKIN